MTYDFSEHDAAAPLLNKVLSTDPIAEIEGDCEIDDADKIGASLGLQIALSHTKHKLLESLGDSTFSMTTLAYMIVIETFGFKKVLEIDFKDRYGNAEKQFFYWKDGLLLIWDTYCQHRNRAHIYCEIEVKSAGSELTRDDIVKMYDACQNGHFSGLCFHRARTRLTSRDVVCLLDGEPNGFYTPRCGIHFDACEAVLHQLNILLKAPCTIVNNEPWITDSHIWMLHHGDEAIEHPHKFGEPDGSDGVNRKRIALLPVEIQKIINYTR